MKLEIWKNFNQEILHSINSYKFHNTNFDAYYSVIECLLSKANPETIYGELGARLKSFFTHADLEHPELKIFLRNLISNEAIREINEINDIASFCIRKGYMNYLPKLKNILSHFVKNKFFLNGKTIGSPSETNTHIRVIKTNNLWLYRKNKKSQKINVISDVPTDIGLLPYDALSCYHHNSEKTKKLREDLLHQRSIFEKLQCHNLLSEIDEAIDKLDLEINGTNMGFRRITLNSIGSVLFKMFDSVKNVYIIPITEQIAKSNEDIEKLVAGCDKFAGFGHNYAVFDHYAAIKDFDADYGFLVGERDSKTYFIGYFQGGFDNGQC